ncbi:MAG: aminotransferase class IV [Actinomycetota bacterium]|nr:aminotransferase class IV [Actinomycetota bacterium]
MSEVVPRQVVWIRGALADPSEASVHWSDHGLTVGDGVFETIELRRGAAFALTRHLDRLVRSAAGLRLPPPDRAQLLEAVSSVAAEWGDEPGRLRITYTAGAAPLGSERVGDKATLVVAAAPMTVRVDPTPVLVVPFTRNERGALVGLKTTSYAENVVALDLAHEVGASEAIFANTAGQLCEGTGSNIFVVVDGELITPTLASGCLAGVTRALLLEALATDAPELRVSERDEPLEVLHRVDEAFLVSTGRHVQPISQLLGDGFDRPLPECPGPVTLAARRVWQAAYDGRLDP